MPLARSRKSRLEESSVDTSVVLSDSEDESIPECAVCLQECFQPCRLRCGHIFCFLCVKGVVLKTPNCPMCRANIPRGYLDKPDILRVSKKSTSAESYKWYYEGKRGRWWEYDARTSADLEEALKAKERWIQVLIVGTLYTIDLIEMVQTKSNGKGSRRMKRSQQPIPTQGVTGITKHRRLRESPLPFEDCRDFDYDDDIFADHYVDHDYSDDSSLSLEFSLDDFDDS